MRSKQNLRFKPHRIGVTAVETWISPVSEERLSHYDYCCLETVTKEILFTKTTGHIKKF